MQNKLKSPFLPLLVLVVLIHSCSVSKDRNSKEPKKIISLSPHITEIIYALGQQDKLVGVTDFCSYPPQARSKEKIGGLLNPNLEKMYALQANLFIGTPASRELAVKMQSRNCNFIFLANDRLQDLYATIDSVGRLLDCENVAQRLNKTLMDSLQTYSLPLGEKGAKRPRALLVIGRDAGSTRNIMAVGERTFISEVWHLSGGSNAFKDLPASYAQVNREALLERQPDLIIEFKFKEEWNAKKNRQNIKEWKELRKVTAVEKENVFVITGDYSLIPGPRLYLLAKDFRQILNRYFEKK